MIRSDSSTSPLPAQSGTVTPDNKTWAFKLRPGVRFQTGEPLSAASVKFSFERAAAADSTSRDKAVFAKVVNLSATDALTTVITLKITNCDLLLPLGQATALIVEPKSAASNATQPVGTGLFRLERWAKRSERVLARRDGYCGVKTVALGRAAICVLSAAAAQVAALLAGDVGLLPHASVARSLVQFKAGKRFQVRVGGSRAKTTVAINNKTKLLDGVRVGRALAMAIGRKPVVGAVADGFCTLIGRFDVPGASGCVDRPAGQRLQPRQVPCAVQRCRHQQAAGVEPQITAHFLRPPGRRGGRGDAGQGGHRGQARKCGVGAVAVGRARPEGLRPDDQRQMLLGHFVGPPRRAGGFGRPGRRSSAMSSRWTSATLPSPAATGTVGHPSSRRCGPRSTPRRHHTAAEVDGQGPAPGGRRRSGRPPLPAHRSTRQPRSREPSPA